MIQALLGDKRIYLRTFKWVGFAKRSTIIAVIAAIGLMGCARQPLRRNDVKWPAAGMGGVCAGNESLSVAREAAGEASRILREIGNRHAWEKRWKIRELRDKAQCIFAAHAERGVTDGMYILALTFLAPQTSAIDWRQPPDAEQRALRLLKKAALKGHGPAFIKSLKIPTQRRKGLREWITEAANAGNLEAQVKLGGAHLEGGPFNHGITRDAKEAERWLTLAAKRGNGFAAAALGRLYESGAPGVEQDKRRAIRLLEPLLDTPLKDPQGGAPLYVVNPATLARLYCAVSEKDKALVMYQRAHNVGVSEAREIMKRACP